MSWMHWKDFGSISKIVITYLFTKIAMLAPDSLTHFSYTEKKYLIDSMK